MSIITTEPIGSSGPKANGRRNGFRFQAADITGTHVIDATDVDPEVPASAAAKTLAARMELPTNVPWALRDDRTGSYLDEQRSLGEQIETDARLTLTPKTHLG